MREILFRAKSKDSGKWVYGYPLIDNADCELKAKGKCVCPHDGTDAEIFYWSNETHEYENEEVISRTIGQYTGITTHNGVKIFCGDVLWDKDEFGVTHIDIVNWDYALFASRGYDWSNFCEVIGNIYDNPELLESGDMVAE